MIESFVLSIPTNVCLTRHTMKMLSMLQSHCRLKHGNNFLYFIFYIFRTLNMLTSQKLLSLALFSLLLLSVLNCLNRLTKFSECCIFKRNNKYWKSSEWNWQGCIIRKQNSHNTLRLTLGSMSCWSLFNLSDVTGIYISELCSEH